ncbi:hypothetical protein [Psychroserpens sp. MEBiC05023]
MMKYYLKRFLILIALGLTQIAVGQVDVDFHIDSEEFIKESDQTFMTKDGAVFVALETFKHDYKVIVADFESEKVQNPEALTIEYFEDKQICSSMEVEKYRDKRHFVSVKIIKGIDDNITLYVMAAFPLKKKDKYYPLLVDAVKFAKIKKQ